MSNEMKEYLEDKEIEKYQRRVAIMIYNYIFETFYGQDEKHVQFRMSYGSKGCCDKVLNFIDDTFIKI